MLNTTYFNLLAGNPQRWDDELRKTVGPDSSIIDVQKDQFERGRRSAILMKGSDGWLVRNDSSLAEFELLFGPGTREDAVRFGIEWANQDPDNREFFALKKDYTP